jgi:hypothetical protein
MYSTNKEYRQSIREFCNMNCQDIDIDIDEESKDELLFDILACHEIMDLIYEKTKNNKLWQGMYDKAAALFISTDREVGLSILFCYDLFWYFKNCWNSFNNDLENFDENNEYNKSHYSKL